MAEATSGRPLVDPWNGHYYLFPLPALIEGADYVIDFRRIGMTHYRNLEDHRIACMNLEGWAAMQRRFAYHTLRADIPLSTRIADLEALWHEVGLWEEWNSRGHPSDGYQPWLNEQQQRGQYAGVARRTLLDYAPDHVAEDIPEPV